MITRHTSVDLCQVSATIPSSVFECSAVLFACPHSKIFRFFKDGGTFEAHVRRVHQICLIIRSQHKRDVREIH